jgi:nitrite reductase (NO-forming)
MALMNCSEEKPVAQGLEPSISRGKTVYINKCLTCHMGDGGGVPGVYPPVAKSDYLLADRARAIKQVLYGAQGKMIVNGKVYNGVMPPQALTNQQAADVLNYIFNSWGNSAEYVSPEEVSKNRK